MVVTAVALGLIVTTLSSQNAMAGGFVCCGVEMEAEEAAEAENTTTGGAANQTANGNMTSSNSTS